MPRVITAVNFDLQFNVLKTPPRIGVTYAENAAMESEAHGPTSIVGDDAADVWAIVGDLLLSAVNEKIDAQVRDVAEPGALVARVAAAAAAALTTRVALEEAEKIAVQAAEASLSLAARLAAIELADGQLAAKRAELAALGK